MAGGRKSNTAIEDLLRVDSLMDIVSNIVGMLVIIGIIAGLNLGNKNFIYETPLAKPSPKRSIFFECIGTKVIPITNDQDYYYHSTYVAFKEVYIPVPEHQKENKLDIESEVTLFKSILESLNPEEEFIALIVRPNGYDTFRIARKMAWDMGFDVGWIPKPQREAVVFSPYGERANVVE